MDRLIEPALNGAPVAWFAPTYRMLNENFRAMRHVLGPIIVSANDTQKRIELLTHGVIDMWSLDVHDAARGRKYQRIIVNEAAQVRNLGDAWSMVIRPTLADMQGDAWFLSTPRGLNEFYKLYQLAEMDNAWAHWRKPTGANPYIKADEIEAMRAMLPERVYRQEILAEFVEDGAYFQNIERCAVITERETREQHAEHSIVMGVDWAKSQDFTVITVGCRNCDRVVDWQRFNQIDYRLQRARLLEMCERWKPANIIVESNSIGEPNLEELQYSGLPVMGFQTTATSKPPLIEGLNNAFVMRGFKVPKEFEDELSAYEIISTSGLTRFSAPAGLHDDTVISLALCNHAMTTGVKVMVNPFYD